MARLPVLPASLLHLLEKLGDEDISLTELARLMHEFPSITVRLVGLSNSALYSPVSPITSVEMACTRLGLRVVRSISIALAVAQPFNPARCPAFNVGRFWTNSLMRGEAAAMLAEMHGCGDVATARTAALISSIGLLCLADSRPDETSTALTLVAQDPEMNINTALLEVMGIDYGTLGADLAHYWELPPMLGNAIANQHETRADAHSDEVGAIVAAAAAITHLPLLEGELDEITPPVLVKINGESTDSRGLLQALRDVYQPTVEIANALFR